MSILIVVAILVVLIIVHEFGHLIAAKLFGVRVEEFGIGFPPRAYTFGKIGETEYTLNWLPFGGFVHLFGEDLEAEEVSKKHTRKHADHKRSFAHASKSSQAVILVAGVLANALFAWVLFSGSLMFGTLSAVPEDTEGVRVLVGSVLEGSPAAKAGLIAGDEIVQVVTVDGEAAVEALMPSAITAFVQERGGIPLSVTYRRGADEHMVLIVPAHGVLTDQNAQPALGVSLVPVTEVRLSVFEAVWQGGVRTTNAFEAVGVALGGLLIEALHGGASMENLMGPVGLVGVVGDSTVHGIGYILGLAAFISVNLAIINLLPIPALDGGRLVFVGVEAATRRAVPIAAARFLNFVGFGLIIFLMIAVTYNDILRLVA